MLYAAAVILTVFVILMIVDRRPRTAENHLDLLFTNFSCAVVIFFCLSFVLLSGGFTLFTLITLYSWIFTSYKMDFFSFQFCMFLFGFISWMFTIMWGHNLVEVVKEYYRNNVAIKSVK